MVKEGRERGREGGMEGGNEELFMFTCPPSHIASVNRSNVCQSG